MQRKSLADQDCPIAQTLDLVGEWWSLLILRDAFRGIRRFETFQESLGVARNILSRRLTRLVAAGILERRRYSERPVREEYRLTDKGRDLFPVIIALLEWGNRWGAATPQRLLDRATGALVEPVLVDATTLRRLSPRELRLAARG